MYAVFAAPSTGLDMQDKSNEIAGLVDEFNNHSLKGNPLISYETAEQLRLKLCPEEEDKTNFWQCYANFGPFIGDIKGTMRAYAQVRSKQPALDGPLLNSFLDDYQAVDAVSYVTERAEKHQFVMFGEEHMDPQSRCLLLPVLRALHRMGYRYFAAETFSSPLDSTNKAGYVIKETGFYTHDPIFAEAVNEAIKLGYTLVAYESTGEPEEIKKSGEPKRSNFREMTQAKQLQERILFKDPNAKALVWAGRGHVYTELLDSSKSKKADEVWHPMAYYFHKLTGLEPLSLILCQQLEMENSNRESSEYKYAAAKGWLKHPTVFVRGGKSFDECGAAQVFFPRQNFSSGRADWLETEIGRVKCPIPQQILFRKGLQLVQAFVDGQSKDAIAIDCVLVRENDPPPPLMLPRHGTFVVRSINNKGESNGESLVQTN